MLNSFVHLSEVLGIPLAATKTVGFTTNPIFLGIQLNTANKATSLPLEKINRYAKNVTKLQANTKAILRELKSCIGKLQLATSVIRSGRPFLRRLITGLSV